MNFECYSCQKLHFFNKNKTKTNVFFFIQFCWFLFLNSISEDDKIFTLLLKNGAELEHETLIGSTALDLATFLGNVPFTQMLIEHGANVNHSALFEDVPLHKTAEFGEIRVQMFSKIDWINSNKIIKFNKIIRFLWSHKNIDWSWSLC